MKEKSVKRCEQIRESQNLTKADLARATGMQQGVIGWIEAGRFVPYDSQLQKLADALGWQGEPQELLEEVGA